MTTCNLNFSFLQCASTPNADVTSKQEVIYAEVSEIPLANSLGDANFPKSIRPIKQDNRERSVTDVNLTLSDGW
jgi:hypothetical protein